MRRVRRRPAAGPSPLRRVAAASAAGFLLLRLSPEPADAAEPFPLKLCPSDSAMDWGSKIENDHFDDDAETKRIWNMCSPLGDGIFVDESKGKLVMDIPSSDAGRTMRPPPNNTAPRVWQEVEDSEQAVYADVGFGDPLPNTNMQELGVFIHTEQRDGIPQKDRDVITFSFSSKGDSYIFKACRVQNDLESFLVDIKGMANPHSVKHPRTRSPEFPHSMKFVRVREYVIIYSYWEDGGGEVANTGGYRYEFFGKIDSLKLYGVGLYAGNGDTPGTPHRGTFDHFKVCHRPPTPVPTKSPAVPSVDLITEPTASPSEQPSELPTEEPWQLPTNETTQSPTEEPSQLPTSEPTHSPTDDPIRSPTDDLTRSPTNDPTDSPSEHPSELPTEEPSQLPTSEPTQSPTDDPIHPGPMDDPTRSPTDDPTRAPTGVSGAGGGCVSLDIDCTNNCYGGSCGPPPDVDTCEKPLMKLFLKYTGGGCGNNDKSQTKWSCKEENGGPNQIDKVRITVESKNLGQVVSSIEVDVDGEFTAPTPSAFINKLGSETTVSISSLDGTLLEETKIHTSCSQYLFPWNDFGSITVVGFEDGDEDADSGNGSNGDGEVCNVLSVAKDTECPDDITTLTFRYVGSSCGNNLNNLKHKCTDLGTLTKTVKVIVSEADDERRLEENLFVQGDKKKNDKENGGKDEQKGGKEEEKDKDEKKDDKDQDKDEDEKKDDKEQDEDEDKKKDDKHQDKDEGKKKDDKHQGKDKSEKKGGKDKEKDKEEEKDDKSKEKDKVEKKDDKSKEKDKDEEKDDKGKEKDKDEEKDDKGKGSDDMDEPQAPQNVKLGKVFTMDVTDNDMKVEIYNVAGDTLLQELTVHTSCLTPLFIGQNIGALRVTKFGGNDGEELKSGLREVTLQYTITNDAGSAITIPKIRRTLVQMKSKIKEKKISVQNPPIVLESGEAFNVSETVTVDVTEPVFAKIATRAVTQGQDPQCPTPMAKYTVFVGVCSKLNADAGKIKYRGKQRTCAWAKKMFKCEADEFKDPCAEYCVSSCPQEPH